MSGNVEEWVADWYADSVSELSPRAGASHVLRGGRMAERALAGPDDEPELGLGPRSWAERGLPLRPGRLSR